MKIPLREDWYGTKRENPSFSSSLLDQIYRSIDESNGVRSQLEFEEIIAVKKMMKKKQQQQQNRDFLGADDRSSVAVVDRRSIAADFERSSARKAEDSVFLKHSSSSSSDSSGFSSSESDSLCGRSLPSRSPPDISDFATPKPVRTRGVERFEKSPQDHRSGARNPNRRELGSFLKTRAKASAKMYSDMKKVKQPISPSRRLASFLSSILNAKKVKKTKKTNCRSEEAPPSTCSSASSFSRSCLSKTPSSTGKSKTGAVGKRSVRFCPESMIVDQDLKPCGHKNLHENKRSFTSSKSHLYEDLELRVMEENRRVVEAAKDLLRNYNAKKVENDSDDDDVASCASSDLFELDNISAIGVDGCDEELPVYGTTNRAIAHGFVV